eukprot:CAMPEP_0184673404 /NCGR_PEP_ID=MMETSP0308-20130426/86661_1 /TAXON_ID=38269 /ORGANISM="Gloeochaete witrockiana, Strain SAG 46.84" /LENGTH=51 /DNA_ID=CAMNT_0027120885 /DNA_START=1759 /DNA_END=1914 /DNA_ORIENTATION=-
MGDIDRTPGPDMGDSDQSPEYLTTGVDQYCIGAPGMPRTAFLIGPRDPCEE